MENEVVSRVRDHIVRHGMIDRNDKVCVAVSGGADSMCLLFLLCRLKEEMGFILSAVHVEHGIRGQASIDDMLFVEKQCENLGVSLEKIRVDAVSAAEETGTTLEEAARNERYRIFSSVEADRIALAHHMNDQAETFIFNAVRGTGIKGLGGIRAVRGRYIRPLLCISREEIEGYCKDNHIEYRQDATNNDIRISRNRIRHIIMPELIRLNDGSIRHISETAEEIREVEEYLEDAAKEAFRKCLIQKESRHPLDMVIDLDALEEYHGAIVSRVIREALIKKAGRAKDITRRHVNAVISLAKGQSGRHVDLIYGLKAYKEFRKLVIMGPGEYEPAAWIRKPEKPDTPEPVYTVLSRAEVSWESILSAESYTKYIDYATIGDASDLRLRHRRQGDHISIKGGNKKLKDLLIEEKIPAGMRDEMFFIALGDEIVWIPDLGRIGERFKINEGTKTVLKMEWVYG